MDSIRLASVLTSKRREKGITQDQLAAYIGVSGAAVSKWEKGLSYPDITLLPQLAAYFNISVDDLLGYSPQMNRDDIWKMCRELSEDFTNKPFDEVMAKCNDIIRKYYSCYPLLLHLSGLFLNHYAIIGDKDKQNEILEKIKVLCRRVISDSADPMLSKDALILQSGAALVQEKPEEVFELLGETVAFRGDLSEADIISQAFELTGNTSMAIETGQCGMYGHLILLVNTMICYITLTANGIEVLESAFFRLMELAKLFNLKELDANAMSKVYYAGAIMYCKNNQPDKALDWLEKYADFCMNTPLPLRFRGDAFFTKIARWLDNELYGEIPYGEKMLRQNMLASLSLVPEIVSVLQDEPRYKRIVERLTEYANG